MNAGFNLLFYGFGSKRCLLNEFCERQLADFTRLSVDAYMPSVNIRTLLNAIDTNLALNCTLSSCNGFVIDWASTIADKVDRLGIDFILVIHNIDGPGLRYVI